MLVEQEVKLVERRPADLPVVFFVQVAQGDGVGQHLVEIVDALAAGMLGQGGRYLDQRAEGLNLVGLLPEQVAALRREGAGVDVFTAMPPKVSRGAGAGALTTRRRNRSWPTAVAYSASPWSNPRQMRCSPPAASLREAEAVTRCLGNGANRRLRAPAPTTPCRRPGVCATAARGIARRSWPGGLCGSTGGPSVRCRAPAPTN